MIVGWYLSGCLFVQRIYFICSVQKSLIKGVRFSSGTPSIFIKSSLRSSWTSTEFLYRAFSVSISCFQLQIITSQIDNLPLYTSPTKKSKCIDSKWCMLFFYNGSIIIGQVNVIKGINFFVYLHKWPSIKLVRHQNVLKEVCIPEKSKQKRKLRFKKSKH